MSPVPLKMMGQLMYLRITLWNLFWSKNYGATRSDHGQSHERVRAAYGHNGSDKANNEEEEQAVVDLALRELACWADKTPDDGGRAKHLRAGADEAVVLVRRADAFDVGEHPSLHAELDCSGDDSSDHLAPEHRTRSRCRTLSIIE